VLAGLSIGFGKAEPAQADYTATNLPDWAIGPFNRYAGNPILSPRGQSTPIPGGFESGNVFNPGVIVRTDPNTHAANTFEMLYRAQNCQSTDGCGAGGNSAIGYATSTDGYTFTRYRENPVISTSSVANAGCGVEDPRLYEWNGTFYAFFTAVHAPCGNGFDLNEAYSSDLIHWTQVGAVELGTKDALVVANPSGTPVQINGQFVMYYGQDNPGPHVAYSTDMIHWHHAADSTPQTGDAIDLHFPARYSPWEMAYAVTDYRATNGGPINHNILMFVAGNLMANGRWFYAISEVLFSRSNLTQQLYQLTDPVLSPTAAYEQTSPASSNAVWLNSIFFYQGQWWTYYGAGDHVVALANAPLRQHASRPPSGTAFTTSFETGERLPDWTDGIDDRADGGGDIANVAPFPGAMSGPEAGVRQEVAHTGTQALMYSGSPGGKSDNHAYLKLFDVSSDAITVGANTVLKYWIYPQNESGTCIAIDLIFSDGTALRNLGVHDENGIPLRPSDQCMTLNTNQWNLVWSNIGSSGALGKQIIRIDLGYEQPNDGTPYRGYIDDISMIDKPSR